VEAATHGLMVTRYQEPRFHFVWHYHLEHELVWVRKGSGTRYVGSSVRHFRDGDLFLLGPNLPHTLASGTQTRHGADWTVVQFRPALWGDGFWNLPETRDLTNLLNQARDGLQFNGSQLPAIGKKMEDLAARPRHTIESLIGFLIILRDLLHVPCESLNATSSGQSGPQPDPRLKRLLEWLQGQAPDDKVTQSMAARQVAMSPEVFSRWFKSRTGRTFRTHRNEIRIARVCSMLAGRGARIGDAAYACGFDNLANFNRRFLELVGITPTEFRRQSKADQERSTMDIIMRMGANDYLHLAAGVLAPPKG
jgi:AraC-like DNA-binding protein